MPLQCWAQFDREVKRHAAGIARCVSVDCLTDGQKVAFGDAADNFGVDAFCDALLIWNKVGGKVLRRITLRHQAEREICLRGLP